MVNPLAHYALGAAGLRALELPRRQWALLSLWSLAPDVDAFTAIAWTHLAADLGLGAEAVRLGGRLFGHRAFPHTFAAAALAALVAWIVTRHRRKAAAVGLAWSLHIVADTITVWSTIPFWPLSTEHVRWPLVTGLDPLMTAISALTVLALLGPIAVDKLDVLAPSHRVPFEAWGRRWGRGLALASAGTILLSAATVGWAAGTTDADVVLPGHTPRTVTLRPSIDADAETWNRTIRWIPPTEGDGTRIPYVASDTGEVPMEVLVDARCAYERMGPMAPIADPVWRLRQQGEGWIVEGRDLARHATDTGGPRIEVAVDDGAVNAAWVTRGGAGGEDAWYRAQIPQVLWQDAPCP